MYPPWPAYITEGNCDDDDDDDDDDEDKDDVDDGDEEVDDDNNGDNDGHNGDDGDDDCHNDNDGDDSDDKGDGDDDDDDGDNISIVAHPIRQDHGVPQRLPYAPLCWGCHVSHILVFAVKSHTLFSFIPFGHPAVFSLKNEVHLI